MNHEREGQAQNYKREYTERETHIKYDERIKQGISWNTRHTRLGSLIMEPQICKVQADPITQGIQNPFHPYIFWYFMDNIRLG